MKTIAILQSNYLPWKGYFDIINQVDEFIIYDEVQYTKNDWRNRNRIKTPAGIQWLTVPVYQRTLNQKISETEVSNTKWGVKHWNTIMTNYARTPYFKTYSLILKDFYFTFKSLLLSEINIALIKLICKQLAIQTIISNSTDYILKGDPTEKLIFLCKQAGANKYLSGPAAKDYLKIELFTKEGIEVQWMDYSNYKEYPQLYPPFDHQVSIIDLLFNVGPSSIDFMKFTK